MSEPSFARLKAASPSETDAIGRGLAGAIKNGDVLLVSGPLGSGKTHLCRAIIRSFLDDPSAQVASPSYTLVNVYTGDATQIWHADLYRVSEPEELVELGLYDAMSEAIVLIEWPERLPELPSRYAQIDLSPQLDDSRLLKLTVYGPGWDALGAAWDDLR